MTRGLSECAGAYCSKGYTSSDVKECQENICPDDWNKQCAYQSHDEVCR